MAPRMNPSCAAPTHRSASLPSSGFRGAHLVRYEGAHSMITRTLQFVLTAAAIVTFSTACARDKDSPWQEEFGIANANLAAKGRNAYFILEPGFQTVLEGDDTKLQITVLNETKTVDG